MFTGLFTGCGPKWVLSPLAPAKPPLVADSGMVVAAHPLAAEAGVSVLRDGGNAVDAALAALFMLNVVEPHASGLGGGGFALVRMAEGEAKVVVYREKAPKAVNPAYYADPADSMRLRAKSGGSAVCVPGSAAGWAELLDRWGTMPLERLTRDAIDAADNGFVVDPVLAGQISGNLEKIAADSQLTNTFLKLGALPYEAGDTLHQPLLAATFRTLTERGLRSFYRGPIAEAVMSVTSREGNPMSLEDLEFYRVEVTEPLRVTYRGCELLTVPPPSSGGAVLIESLSLFEATNATAPGIGTPESVHLMSQCIQQAYADAAVRVQDGTDPTALSKIWSAEHLKTAAASISAKAKPGAKLPIKDPDTKDIGNTTHLVVVDRFGNAVSLTQSINYFFGAGVMAPGTGLLLNNELADFNRLLTAST